MEQIPMEQLLTKLKNIEPSQDYKERSRSLILSSPQGSLYPKILGQLTNTFQFGAAFGMAAVFIFLILGGLSVLNKKVLSPTLLSGVSQENISLELEKIDFQIQLSQAEYYEDSAAKIEVALNKTSQELENGGEVNKLLDKLSL
jgi:hypothetical protein